MKKNNLILIIFTLSVITFILSVISITISIIALGKSHKECIIYGAEEIGLIDFFSGEINDMYYDGSIYFLKETGSFYNEEILNEMRSILINGAFQKFNYKINNNSDMIGVGPSPFIRFQASTATFTFAESSGESHYIGITINNAEFGGYFSSIVRLKIDAVINKAKT